jgi:catechol 2,3-dioxygenase-like lactoylglutathione lyase family enzyme
MVKTYGLTHISLTVRDPERSSARAESFYGGEFSPGFPFAYVEDPDGYEIEIWYE